MITTDKDYIANRMRLFRNHGITTDHRQRDEQGSWFYEMIDLGYNYRITDFQCALGLNQLKKLSGRLSRRQDIALQYDEAFLTVPAIESLKVRTHLSHAYHLYVIQLRLEILKCDRGVIFSALRKKGIGVNVHYIPVHTHPFFRKRFGTKPGDCPIAESAYERLLTLPLFPNMSSQDIDKVIRTVSETINKFVKN
jgi:perosamine synthetase